MKSFHLILLTITLVALSCNAPKDVTQTQVPTIQPTIVEIPDPVEVTSVEGITEYRLHNGLKVLLFPDQSKQTATVNITYLVGSRHEGYGETGMAHLLEHLVFKGTPKHPNIPQELTEHGASPNGTTWYDRTNYFETFNATDENMNWALDLESDRMINSYIAKKDLDSEMTVVRNEYERGENDPGSVLYKKVLATAFDWHNYGNVTIGSRSDLENVPIGRLQAFYRKYYQPDNAVLLVAGKFDPKKTLGTINMKFGAIEVPDREADKLYKTYTKEPTQEGERHVTLRRVGETQNVVIAYHTPPGPHPEYAAIAVLDEIMTGEPSGRMYKALVEDKKAAYQWGFAPGLAEGGYIVFGAEARKETNINETQQTMMKTLDAIVKNPPTEEEVNRAKTKILKNWDMNFNNANRVGVFLSNYIAQGDWRLLFKFRDRVNEVSAADVLMVANKYFKPSNRTTGVFYPEEAPDRSEIPSTPDIAQMLEGYTGGEAIAQGEEFDPSHENIESRTNKVVNPNGPDYAYLTKETRGDKVVAQIVMRYGNESALSGKSTIADLCGSMLNKGTKTMTRQEIQDKLDGLKANVFIGGGTTSNFVRIQTSNENLEETTKLVMDMLKNPVFDENEFEKIKEEELAYLESQKTEPRMVARIQFNRMMEPYPKGHPNYTMTLDEQIAAIKGAKLADVKKFHEEFYGAGEATVSIVGDFEKEKIGKILTSNLNGWSSKTNYERVGSKYFPTGGKEEKIQTDDKANAFFTAGQSVKMNDAHPDYPSMVLGNFMLGGGFLNSRLATRIRQKEGLSYTVRSYFYADSQDETATFGSFAIYAPENLEKLEAAFKEEIQKVIDSGFTSEEIESAKNGWLQSRVVRRSEDGRLVGSLNSNLFLERDMNWSKELEEKIAALTPAQINAAMKKHLDLSKFNYVRAGDFKKAEMKSIKP